MNGDGQRGNLNQGVGAVLSVVCLAWMGFVAWRVVAASDSALYGLEFTSPVVWQGYVGEWGRQLFVLLFPPLMVLGTVWMFILACARWRGLGGAVGGGLERVVLGWGVGAVVIGYGTLVLGWPLQLLGATLFRVIYALLLLGGVCVYFVMRRRDADAGAGNWFRLGGCSALEKAFLVFAAGALVLLWLYAATPPIQSDGMRYHLTGPQEYLKRGAVEHLPLNAFTNFPFLAEMLFLFSMAGLPDISAKLVHFLFFVATLGGIYLFWRNVLARGAGGGRDGERDGFRFLAPFLVLTAPVAYIVAGWEFIDHFTGFFFLLMLYALARYKARDWGSAEETGAGRWVWLVLCGVFGGAAAGTKYTMIPLVMLAAAYLLASKLFARDSGSVGRRAWLGLREAAVVGGIALLLFSPWMLKNWRFTGNPFYPLANEIFHNAKSEWSPKNQELYLANAQGTADANGEKVGGKGTHFYYQRALGEGDYLSAVGWLLRSPVDATVHYRGYEQQFLGFAFLLGLPLLFFSLWRARLGGLAGGALRLLLLFAGAYWLLWFHVYQSNRFLIPLLPVVALLIAWGLRETSSRWPAPGRLVTGVVVAAGLFGYFWSGHYLLRRAAVNPAGAMLGFESRDSYIGRALNYYPLARVLPNYVEPGERVLFVGEYRGYHFQGVDFWASDYYDTPVILRLIRQTPDNDALFRRLLDDGFRYVLFNQAELRLYQDRSFRPRFSDVEWRRYEAFVSSPRLRKIPGPTAGVYLCRITPPPPPGAVGK